MTRRTGSAGFTLVEMLVVLGIMITVAGIAIPVFLSSRAQTRQSDADNSIRAALAAAREAAIQRRTVVAVEFISYSDAQRGDVMVLVDKSDNFSGSDRRIGPPLPLPDFIKLDTANSTLENGWNGDPTDDLDTTALVSSPNPLYAYAAPPYPDIAYLPDGSLADPEGTTDIVLMDTTETNTSGQPVRQVLRALPTTGLVVDAWHLEDPTQAEGPANIRNKGWL